MMKKKKFLKLFKFILVIFAGFIILSTICVITCRLIVKSTAYDVYYQGELSKVEGFDYILVPGAGINAAKPGTHLQDRLDTAISLYQAGAANKIIVSGGYDEDSQLLETVVMKLYLEKAGIPTEDITCDDSGKDTASTLRYIREYASDKHIIICTQSLYTPRTAFLAKCFNLNVAFADSDIKIYTTDVGKERLREMFAATKAVFEGMKYK